MDNKRLQRRSAIRMRCPGRTLDGVPIELELLDLSERGCLARSVGFPLLFGQALRLFPEGCDEFTATVRRSTDDICGIEFDRDLPLPVFERMRCYVPLPDETDENPAGAPATGSPPAVIAEPDRAQMPEPVKAPGSTPYGSLLTAGRKAHAKKMAIF